MDSSHSLLEWARAARADLGQLRADVVVVGAGMGGLTAAVRAQREGARVVLLEKGAEPGGTMRWSAGLVWTYADYEWLRHDISDGDADLQRALCENLPRAWNFLEEVGVAIGPIQRMNQDVGLTRTIKPPEFTDRMVGAFESSGGVLLTETPLTRLLTNQRGEVVGVSAEGPGGPTTVVARAVVLATGGFQGNAELVKKHITPHFEQLWQRNSGLVDKEHFSRPLSTGDGLLAALEVGAAPSAAGFDSFYGHLLPARPARFTRTEITLVTQYHGNACVALNLRGERFADETYRGDLHRVAEETLAEAACTQPEATVAYLWDEPIQQQFVLGRDERRIDRYATAKDAGGPVARADSLEELARQMEAWGRGLSARRVLATLREFNQAAANGRAAQLPIPKSHPKFTFPIVRPPLYAVLGTPGITGTQGGLRANPRGQVLSRQGKPIPGLYAAGIDIGGIGAWVYCGMLCYGAAFGYISGAEAARAPEPRDWTPADVPGNRQ